MLTTFVPALLARVTRIGPRKVAATGSVQVPEGWVAALQGEDVAAREPAWAALRATATPDLADALAAGTARAWTLECAWLDPGDQRAGRGLVVVDGSAGTWVLDEQTLRPTTATEVWRAITRLLPDDDERHPGIARDVGPGLDGRIDATGGHTGRLPAGA